MKQLLHILLFTILGTSFTLMTNAQDENGWLHHGSSKHVDISFAMATPHPDFAHNTHSTGLGGFIEYYHPLAKSFPIFLGARGGATLF